VQDRSVCPEAIVTSVALQVTANGNNRSPSAHHDARAASDGNSPFASMLDGQTSDANPPPRPDASRQQDTASRSDAAQRPDRP
jgi:hypothetical protein